MKAPDTALGKRVRCKRCHETLTVSGPPPAPMAAQGLVAAAHSAPPKKGGGIVWAFIAVLLVAGLGIGGYFSWPALSSLFVDAKANDGTPVAQAKDKQAKDRLVAADKQPASSSGDQDKKPEPSPATEDKSKPAKKAPKENEPAKLPPDKGKVEQVKKDGKIPDFPDLDPSTKKEPNAEGPTKTPDGALTVRIHPTRSLRFLAVNPDGKTLYTAAWDEVLRFWDLDTLIEQSALPLPKPDKERNTRLQAALAPDGKHIVYNHWEVLQIVDLETKKIEAFTDLPKGNHNIQQVHFSRDGTHVITHWGNVSFALWNVPRRKFVAELRYDAGGLAHGDAVALAPDATYWIHTANNTNGARLLSVPDSQVIGECFGTEKIEFIDMIAFDPSVPVVSPSGKWLAYAQRKKNNLRSIRVFDLAARKLIHEMPFTKLSKKAVLEPRIASIAFAPDEKTLLVLDDHRGVHGYNLDDGSFLGAFTIDTPNRLGNEAKTAAFTPDGRRVVIGCDNYVKVWDRAALPLKKE